MNDTKKPVPTSVFLLLAANIVPILGIIFFKWNVVNILFLYWAESAVIGFWNVMKILSFQGAKKERASVTFFSKAFASLFFIVHFGGFMAGHFMFIFALAQGITDIAVHPLDLLAATWIGIASLFVSHGYSFVFNFLLGNERKQGNEGRLMLQPYARIIVMHLTIIFGFTLVSIFGQPIMLLLLFVVLKTGVDLASHVRERIKFGFIPGGV
jgi:hypothetical protein